MKITEADPIVRTRGPRERKPNPFAPYIDSLNDGKTHRITLEPTEKALTVIEHLREAAKQVKGADGTVTPRGLSVQFDPTDDTKEGRKAARTFRFELVTPRVRQPKSENGDVATPEVKPKGKGK